MAHLHFCDFGINTIASTNDFVIQKLNSLPRILPKFSYECKLNTADLAAKLVAAKEQNDFVDFSYLNDRIDFEFLNKIALRVDFSQSLENFDEMSCQSTSVVDIYDSKSNKNLIDIVIENALADLKNHSFPCIVSMCNSLSDFYVQKVDATSEEVLLQLQGEIQAQVHGNKLKLLESIHLNKPCVSFYEEDGQYYRAKIIGMGDCKEKNKIEASDAKRKVNLFFELNEPYLVFMYSAPEIPYLISIYNTSHSWLLFMNVRVNVHRP